MPQQNVLQAHIKNIYHLVRIAVFSLFSLFVIRFYSNRVDDSSFQEYLESQQRLFQKVLIKGHASVF